MSTCIKCGVELVPGAVYCHICGKKQVKETRKALKRPNGAGTVYKLSGRRTRPWAAAKNHVIIGYYERKTDALAALEKLSGKPIEEKFNMTFSEVFAEWKAEHFREIGPQGIESYNQAYKVCTSLYPRKFRDLRTKDFQAIIDSNMAKSNSTLSKYKQLMTQMSRWAVREEIATTDFAKYVKLPQQVKKEKAIFTDDEIALLEKDGSDAAKIALMLIYTGMRIGELFSLPLADYHETYVIGGEKTEAGKNRVIPIRPEGRKYFAYFAGRADGDLLLSGYDGQRIPANYRKRDFYPLLEKLGIPKHTPHATRHTYATWARNAGIQPDVLQKILGHADFSTTANIYVHADTEKLISAVESVSNLSVTEKA